MVIKMKLINSYIFLLREENKPTKNENGNYYINVNKGVLYLLKQKYNAIEDGLSFSDLELSTKKSQKQLKNSMRGIKTGELILKNKKIRANFKLSKADTTEYLDIILTGNKKSDLIKEMEEIHTQITGVNNIFNKDYIVIISYDAISEYYCNKVYPFLNKFERKFRKLLFITYTAQFKKAYFEETTSVEIQSKAKQKIRVKDNDIRLQEYLYSIDFGMMNDLLFEKRWTPYDEKQLEKYLKKHKNLSDLSDEELRNKIKSIHPINDWERLFSNKGLDPEFDLIIKEIGILRNLVAHNKLFSKNDYNKLKKLLQENIKIVEKAILITEDEDFKKINDEKFQESIELVREIISKSLTSIGESFTSAIKHIQKIKFPKFFLNSVFDDKNQN